MADVVRQGVSVAIDFQLRLHGGHRGFERWTFYWISWAVGPMTVQRRSNGNPLLNGPLNQAVRAVAALASRPIARRAGLQYLGRLILVRTEPCHARRFKAA